MTISFAGVNLLLEDPEGRAAAFVRRYLEWPHSQINSPSRMIDSKSRIQPPKWPSEPKLKPNQLYVPTGATRWSRFIGLTDTAGKDAILAAVVRGGAGNLCMSLDDNNSVSVSPSKTKVDGALFNLQAPINTEMILLPPVPVSGADDPLWVIPLVDARFQWQTRAFVSVATTWAALLTEISESLGLTVPFLRDDWFGGSEVPVDANYGIPDACYFRNGMINTAAAIDMYCWSTGQRLVVVNRQWNPGTAYALDEVVVNNGVFYTCTTAGTSDTGTGPTGTGTKTDNTVTWLGTATGSPTYVLRSSQQSPPDIYQRQRDAQLTNTSSGSTSAGGDFDLTKGEDVPQTIKFHFTNDGANEIVSPITGGTSPAWATGGTLDLVCPATATDSNSTDLTDMADRWANDFYQWSKYRFYWSMNRFLSWSPSGYEDYVLTDASRSRRGRVNARTFIKSLPPLSWGADFVPMQLVGGGNSCGGSGGESGGGGGAGGCACCGCLNCVDLCEQLEAKTVTDCDACPNAATKSVVVDFGGLGIRTLVHTTGCTWENQFTYSGGTYKATYTAAGISSTCVVTWVSGSDPLKLKDGVRLISYKPDPDKEWSCICNSTMIPAVKGERFPSGISLNCEICIAPKAETGTDPDLCESVCYTLVVEGIESASHPCMTQYNGTFAMVAANGSLAKCGCRWEAYGNSVHPSPSILSILPPCVCGTTFANRLMWSFSAVDGALNLGPNDLGGGVYASYQLTSGDPCTNDDLVFTLSPGGVLFAICGAYATLPETVTMTRNDCTFGATHPDTGYGCGAGSGVCTGCDWHTIISGGVWAWATTFTDCAGCTNPGGPTGCMPPEVDPTEGATIHTSCYGS